MILMPFNKAHWVLNVGDSWRDWCRVRARGELLLTVCAPNLAIIRINIKGSQPEWCISSMIYSRDTPFWSKTFESSIYSRWSWRWDSVYFTHLLILDHMVLSSSHWCKENSNLCVEGSSADRVGPPDYCRDFKRLGCGLARWPLLAADEVGRTVADDLLSDCQLHRELFHVASVEFVVWGVA